MSRKMPPHIVLPNGMWRFVKRGAKTNASKKSRAKRGRVSQMAKYRRRSSSGFGGSGMLKKAAFGAGAAIIANMVLGQKIPYQGAIIGYVAGGPIGAVAGLVVPGMLGTQSSGGASTVPLNG